MSNLGRILLPDQGREPGHEPGLWRVLAWAALVLILAAVNYAARATGGEPDPDILYKSSTAVAAIVQNAFMLLLIVGIAGSAALLALRHPRSWWRALGLAVLVLIAVGLVTTGLETVLDAGKEQGLTPEKWDPTRAGAYTFNFVVIAALVPIVEEIVFRGVGFSLLRRWGSLVAIGGTAVAFAAAHGLVEGFPILLVFGVGLAWLRLRTDSVFPCIAVHSAFNAIALIAAVTT